MKEHAASLSRWVVLRGAACAGFWMLAGARLTGNFLPTWILAVFAIVWWGSRERALYHVREGEKLTRPKPEMCPTCGAPCLVCAIEREGAAYVTVHPTKR